MTSATPYEVRACQHGGPRPRYQAGPSQHRGPRSRYRGRTISTPRSAISISRSEHLNADVRDLDLEVGARQRRPPRSRPRWRTDNLVCPSTCLREKLTGRIACPPLVRDHSIVIGTDTDCDFFPASRTSKARMYGPGASPCGRKSNSSFVAPLSSIGEIGRAHV